ncbi:MAG: tRNA (adenosine(37)-N6)-threonylcarbamoyltransferase complex transferase subunit TsaD [Myxococcales bacterium]|nr:MAG: tRNA (adenosine(37)-N6)-threonylcarbamoyltransferase complex transferase subunit TsaD [Myxococcales bacterium]
MRDSSFRLVLGIESSCDETACAVLEDGRRLLASEVASQVDEHARFGGVVPEIASRQHLAALFPLLDRTLAKAGVSVGDLDAVAVTRAPGLIGALLVGVSAAKALAYALDLPLIGVNHLEGHLMAARLLEPPPEFPVLGLVVSGGHTALYLIERPGEARLLGNTRDDAAGEAFDKVAKLLNLGYPGGVAIQQTAENGDPRAIAFPRPMLDSRQLDFSFSGLKTAVRQHVSGRTLAPGELADLCASFQEAAVDTLVAKSLQALRRTGLRRWLIAGGVAANRRLREKAQAAAKRNGATLYQLPLALCSDNAAMIAAAGWQRLVDGARDGLTLNAQASEDVF